ncbi:hypothetical protein ACSYDW_12985 [Paeniglutamicibacter sp. R2-26]|uniref:hypothetical protein n=1 Tax=Paeniglutamicibacter sp. R2-26 TaxID=3144417 RepID=UPI003EE4B237
MKPQTAFLKMLGILLGTLLLAGGSVIGIGVLVAANPPEPLRELREYIYHRSLTDEESAGILRQELLAIEGVSEVEITPTTSEETLVLVETVDPEPGPALEERVEEVCEDGMRLWTGFEPHQLTCTVAGGSG